MEKLTVVCVNWNNFCGRGAEYVNVLYDMVKRNLPEGYQGKFVCFTDDDTDLNRNIECRDLPKDLNGWWNKLYIFKKVHFEENERVLYLDLDTIITGALDNIVTYEGDFAMLSDFYNPDVAAGGVIMWKGDHSYLWDKWLEAGSPEYNGSIEEGFGEAGWIQKFIKPDRLQDLFPKEIVSYKVHARHALPEKAKIVCFHGEPRPHMAEGWVKDFWKINGASTFYSKVVGNTDGEKLVENIRYAMGLGLPRLKPVDAHFRHAVIVGGGPSLKDTIEEIKARQLHGQIIFSTNATCKYLMDHNIIPDYHIMIDARPEMAEFVGEKTLNYYASQCDKSVFDKANNVHLWHHFSTDITDVLPKDSKNEPLVGLGSSVGLKAIAVAHILGYRNMHLYGFDSCYKDDNHHAYSQNLNDEDRVLEVTMNGKSYRAAPWMCAQVEEFKEVYPHLDDTVITCHGEGLFQDVFKTIANYEDSDYYNQPRRTHA